MIFYTIHSNKKDYLHAGNETEGSERGFHEIFVWKIFAYLCLGACVRLRERERGRERERESDRKRNGERERERERERENIYTHTYSQSIIWHACAGEKVIEFIYISVYLQCSLLSTLLSICVFVYIPIHRCIFIYTYRCVFVHIHICIYVCKYVYTYVCIYMYMHISM